VTVVTDGPYSTGAECQIVNVEKVQPDFFSFSQTGFRKCLGSAMTLGIIAGLAALIPGPSTIQTCNKRGCYIFATGKVHSAP